MSAAVPLVRFEAAHLGYGKVTVLEDVTLSVRTGDFIGLVGPNGSGKTTLFRALLGWLKPIEGHIERSALAVGYVPQREHLDALFPLTVREVTALGSPKRPPAAKVLEALAAVNLEDRARTPFARLSGGQRQRVLLARALMNDPELLLLDEPTSGVDEKSRGILEGLLRARNEAGATVLMVSHDLASVRRCARTLWRVAEGGVHVEGAEHVE